MAEISVYRAQVLNGPVLEGEVYSLQPIPDQNFSRASKPLLHDLPHVLEVKDGTEIRIAVPDELYIEHGPYGIPAVRISNDPSAKTHTALELVQQVRQGTSGFAFVDTLAGT